MAAVATIVAAVVGVTILVAKRRRRQPDRVQEKDSWDVSSMFADSDTEVDQIPTCEEMKDDETELCLLSEDSGVMLSDDYIPDPLQKIYESAEL